MSVSLSQSLCSLSTDYATFLKLPLGNTNTTVRPTVPPHSRRLTLHFYNSSFGNHKVLQISHLRSPSFVCSIPAAALLYQPICRACVVFESTSVHFEVYIQAGSQIKENSLMLKPGGKEMEGRVSAGSYIYALFLPHNTEICDF